MSDWLQHRLESWQALCAAVVGAVAATWGVISYAPKIYRVTKKFYESVLFLLEIQDTLKAMRAEQAVWFACMDDGQRNIITTRRITLDCDDHTAWAERDERGRIRWVSDVWSKWTGIDARAASGNGWELAIAPEDRTRVVQGWQLATDHQRDFYDCFVYVDRVGNRITVESSSKAVRRKDGTILGYFGYCRRVDVPRRSISLSAAEPNT